VSSAPDYPLLQIDSLSKQYDGCYALEQVDFEIQRGEVLALAGENGAGKSTLVRIISGILPADSGRVRLDGRDVSIRSPADARALGIAVVHQDFDLAPNMTIAENLLLGSEPQWLPGFVDRVRQRELVRRRLDRVGLALHPDTPVAGLDVAQRQLVAIAGSIASPVRLLVLDEPTSSLAASDIEHLLGLIEAQRAAGTAVLFISHKLDEVFRIADRITVLRDGRNAGTRTTAATHAAEVISMMVGRELRHPEQRDVPAGDVLLDVRGLRAKGLNGPVDLSLRAGETLGLYGLKGAGRFDLLRALFGLQAPDAGEIHVVGSAVRIRSPRDAIRHGIGWVCRDRNRLGLFSNLDLRENLSISALDSLARGGFIKRRAERAAVEEYTRRLGIRAAGPHQAITALSGGNQQKVLLARCLLCRPRVLILDEPTAGIDVGAKSEIYALIQELRAAGIGILLVSSELPEVLALSDRVLVMHDGALAGALDRAEATEQRVMQLIHARAFDAVSSGSG
jgi:ABC-type sugar transport system ATPase subunit